MLAVGKMVMVCLPFNISFLFPTSRKHSIYRQKIYYFFPFRRRHFLSFYSLCYRRYLTILLFEMAIKCCVSSILCFPSITISAYNTTKFRNLGPTAVIIRQMFVSIYGFLILFVLLGSISIVLMTTDIWTAKHKNTQQKAAGQFVVINSF